MPPILEIFKCAHHEQTHRYATSEHQILRQEMREKEQIKYISYFCKCKHLYLCNMHSSIRKMVLGALVDRVKKHQLTYLLDLGKEKQLVYMCQQLQDVWG